MYANSVTRGGGPTLSRGKGCESAITVHFSFKGNYDYCHKPKHNKPKCFKFLRKSGEGSLSSAWLEVPDSVHTKRTFTLMPPATFNSNNAATAWAAV